MKPLETNRSARAIAESVRAQLGTDALVLILPGSPACAVVIATDTTLASALAASTAATSQPPADTATAQGDGRLAYSVLEAAEAIGVSKDIIYAERRSGRLASVKIGRRRIITRQHLDDFLADAGSRR
jgi:excisionase family DNA binding protein